MAKVKLTDIISDIRGRVGTHIFSIWKGVHTVRMEPKNFHYPWRSQFNWQYRKNIGDTSRRWVSILTLLQREEWQQFASILANLVGAYAEGGVERMPGLRRYGGAMTGLNAYALINALRRSVGKTNILDDAPLSEVWPDQPVFTSFELTSNGSIGLKAVYQDPGTLPKPAFARAWFRGQRTGHLLIGKFLAIGSPFTLEWDTMHGVGGVVLDLLPDTYDCQIDFITEDGLFSPPSEIKTVRVANPFPGGIWGDFIWNGYAWG